MIPRLLVSVRNVSEAEAALAGGCDVLDVKEPARGAMGMADVQTITAVVSRVYRLDAQVPVSVALGETSDWEGTLAFPGLPAQIAYFKLGTARLGATAQWRKRFTQIAQQHISARCRDGHGRGATAGDAPPGLTSLIAVAYADWETACGPSPEMVIEGAAECGCRGVLI